MGWYTRSGGRRLSDDREETPVEARQGTIRQEQPERRSTNILRNFGFRMITARRTEMLLSFFFIPHA